MSESPDAALPAWMGGVDPNQIGFPFPLDRGLYRKEAGLVFKETDRGPLHLDAYWPTEGSSPPPLVVMVHGGGWQRGGRFEMGLTRWAGYLASAGLAVLSIDYRLAPHTTYPDSFEDCLDGIQWGVEQADARGWDASRLALWGDSAGGHLVLLLGTSQSRSEFAGPHRPELSERLRGVVAWYPPTDLRALHAMERKAHDGPTMTGSFVGAEPDQAPDRWTQASPIEQVHEDAPPMLILQGTRDLLVPHSQATAFADRAQTVGAPHELHIVEGGVHGFDRVAPGSEAKALIERTREFLCEKLVADARTVGA